jgi:hypothetical protein
MIGFNDIEFFETIDTGLSEAEIYQSVDKIE